MKEKNKKIDHYLKIIDEIEKVRTHNNVNWMDILRLAFTHAPEEAKKLNLLYYDATCPLVSKIHREVEHYDKNNLPIILIGHRNHPEVIGTMGQTNKKMHLVENINDVLNQFQQTPCLNSVMRQMD